MADQRESVQQILQRAIDRGELPLAVDTSLAIDLLAGPLFYRRLVTGAEVNPPGFVTNLIDTVLTGLGHPSS